MTAKLIKHEYLRTRGIVSLILGIALVAGLGGILLAWLNIPMISQFGMVLTVLSIVLVIPAVQLFLGLNYWLTSYRDQGYFTQMLPVRGATIYRAKLAWGMLVTIAALAVAAVNFFLALFVLDLSSIVGQIWQRATESLTLWAWVAIIALAVSYLFYLLISLYFMATIGSLEPLNRWGIGGPIVVGIITYTVIQILTLLCILLIPLGAAIKDATVELQFYSLGSLFTSVDFAPVGWIPLMIIVPIVMSVWTAISWNKGASLN